MICMIYKYTVGFLNIELSLELGPIHYNLDVLKFYLTSAKLNNLNFQRLEVVSHCRDPQLQVGENICLV